MNPVDRRALASNDTLPDRGPSDRTLRDALGPRNLDRARLYLDWGAVFDTRREGDALLARCEGSHDEHYRVRCLLDGDTVLDAVCSCPVGEAGACKHTGAVLLAWRHEPARFVAVTPLDDALAALGRGPLLDLVRALRERRPELDPVLDTLVPGRAITSTEAPDDWRARASVILRERPVGEHADALEALLREGLARPESDDPMARAHLHDAVARCIVGRWRRFGPDAAPALAVARRCLDALGEAFAQSRNARDRETLAATLLAYYRFDIEQGTATHPARTPGRHALALLTAHATDDERRALAALVRDRCEDADAWPRRAWQMCLLELEDGLTDDGAWEAQARALQRHGALVRHLARNARLDEALEALPLVPDAELVDVAPTLVAHGRAMEVEAHLTARLARASEANRARLSAWLRGRADARRDALALTQTLHAELLARPDLAAWDALRDASLPHGLWPEARAAALAALEARGHTLALDVLLRDGDLDAMLRVCLGEHQRPTAGLSQRHALVRALEDRPRDARAVLRSLVEGHIAMRSRAHYREAARLVPALRALDLRLDDAVEGERWLQGLRARHAGLPALQQELDAHLEARPAA